MENSTKAQSTGGDSVFINFIKATPESVSEFDYFSFLDHIAKNKHCDKQAIINILHESIISR